MFPASFSTGRLGQPGRSYANTGLCCYYQTTSPCFNLPDVAVEIVKDELRSGPSTTGCLSPVVLSGMAKGGESIAPCYEDSGAWTLGGFVEIKSPLDQKWHIHGLTCFHCVVCDPATLQDFPNLVVNKNTDSARQTSLSFSPHSPSVDSGESF